jgi:hypothetical protein
VMGEERKTAGESAATDGNRRFPSGGGGLTEPA